MKCIDLFVSRAYENCMLSENVDIRKFINKYFKLLELKQYHKWFCLRVTHGSYLSHNGYNLCLKCHQI